MTIQWYPGHMAKTRRMISRQMKQVDAVCEILDARIPYASRNPDIDALAEDKPRLIILNRADQADQSATDIWANAFQARHMAVLRTNARDGAGTKRFTAAVEDLLSDRRKAFIDKGQSGRILRVMILGIPNVGKSTLINRVAGRKIARAEDRPGVTRSGQWVRISQNLELLDTPGILWPKFEDKTVGLYLAYTGAVKDEILDTETLGCHLMALLGTRYPEALAAAYKLPELPKRLPDEEDIAWGWRLLECAGKRRGFLISGGEVNTERMANSLLDEFRSGKLGRFTLELPSDGYKN